MDLEAELEMPLAGIVVVSGSVVSGIGAIALIATVMWIMKRRYLGQAIASKEPLMSQESEHLSSDTNSLDGAMSAHTESEYQLHDDRRTPSPANSDPSVPLLP